MDYTITKVGRVCQITPIPQGFLSERLESGCSYQKAGAQFMPNPMWSWVKLYKIKTGRFPAGLIEKVKRIFEDVSKLQKDISLKILIPKSDKILDDRWKLLNPKLREYQKDVILQLVLNNGGVVSLPTGAGKTFVATEYIKLMDRPTLVVVPTIDLKIQWERQVTSNTDVKTYQSIKDYSILQKYQIIVFDETHHVSSKVIYNIAMKGGNSIMVGLSATPFREDKEDMKITAAVGEIIYSIDRRTLIDKGYLSDATIYYTEYSKHSNDRFLSYGDIYKSYIVDNEDRNQKIIKIIIDSFNQNKKVLCLVTQIEHGETLYNLLIAKKLEPIFLHGKIKGEDRKVEDKHKIVIASTIFDEGVDVPDFDVLVLATGGKSAIKVIQRIGRILRPKIGKHAIVYDFIDRSRYLFKHYKRRRELLEKDFKVIDVKQ